MEEKKNINLLTDIPVDEDDFGGHSKVAKAIVELVESEIGGKSMALTGHWGSGKSSIVKMIKQGLKDKGIVFEFNAWAHEGDPLRRSFLEKFIFFAISKKYIDKDKWQGILDQLSRRKEQTSSREVKTPTIYGIILLFITALIPLAFFVLTLWPNISMLLLVISLMVIVAPSFLSLVAILLLLFLKNSEIRKRFFKLLSTDSDIKVDTDTFRTNDPTSIEFQGYFYQLMNEVFNNQKDKKILIVIDNLDRIDDEDALKMWSTMRAFFEFDSDVVKDQNWVQNTWLLVPYDFSGLKRLWDKGSHNSDKDLPLVHSFTEKTFQVSFETPLLVTSDTYEYFAKNLKRALPDYNISEEILRLYNVFRYLRRPNSLSPTPREIILFINNLTAIYRQRRDQIPLHIQGVYVIKRKCEWQNDSDLIEALQNWGTTIIDNTLTEFSDSDLREFLAALYFNTEMEKALQLLLSDKIGLALETGDEEVLNKLGGAKGITMICEEIIRMRCENWATTLPHILGNASFVLAAHPALEDINIKAAWAKLATSMSTVKKWGILENKSAIGIVELLKKSNNKELVNHLLDSFTQSNELFEEQGATKDKKELVSKDDKQILLITDSLLKVLHVITALSFSESIDERFRVNCKASTFIKICKAVMNSKQSELGKYFLLKSEEELLVKYLVVAVEGNILNDFTWYPTIKHLVNLYNDLGWAELSESIDVRLKDIVNPSSEQIQLLIQIQYLLKKTIVSVDEGLKNLVINGYIPHHLHRAFLDGNNKTIAICILCIFDYAINGKIISNVGESVKGINKYNEIMKEPENSLEMVVELIELFKEFDIVNKIFEIRSIQEKFSNAVIKNIVLDEQFTKLVSSQHFIEHEDDFFDSLSTEEYLSATIRYTKETDLVHRLIEKDFSIEIASLYATILNADENIDQEFISHLKEGLNNLSFETWKSEFDNLANCYDLLVVMYDKHIKPSLKSVFKDVLIDFVKRIQNNELDPAGLTINWPKFISALDDDHKTSFLNYISHKIIHENIDFSKIVVLFGNILIDCDLFKDHIDDLVNIGFNSILNRENTIELNWMLKIINSCPIIINKCSSRFLNPLKDKIKHRLIDMNEEQSQRTSINEILTSIASILEIELNSDS